MTQYNLTVQQEITRGTLVSVGYQGSHGTHLARLVDANTAIPQVVNGTLFNPPNAVRRNPTFNQLRNSFFDGNSFYNAFKFGVQRRFKDGLQLQSAYTYSRSVDDSSNAAPFDSTGVSPNGVENLVPDNHKWDRGLSSFDARHVWSFNATYGLPFGQGKLIGQDLTGVWDKLVSGWQLSTIVTVATGPPLNLLMSFDNSRSRAGVDLSERPNLNPGASNSPVLADGRDPNRYYDPTAFSVPAPGTFGNLGRATVIEPGVANVDLSLVKNMAVNERVTLQFRAEGFNVGNRANFGIPNPTVFTSASGIPSGAAGRITTTTTTSRQIQFGMRIVF